MNAVWMAKLKYVITLVVLIIHLKYSSQDCDRTGLCPHCTFCDGSDCSQCQHGSYQQKSYHLEAQCHDWTPKPPGDNWIVKEEGTCRSDRIWDCKEGYKKNQFSSGGDSESFQCIPVSVALPPTTSTIVPSEPDPTVDTEFPLEQSNDENDGLDEGVIAGIAIVVFIALVILVLIILYFKVPACKRRFRKIICKTKSKENSTNDGEDMPLRDKELISINLDENTNQLNSGTGNIGYSKNANFQDGKNGRNENADSQDGSNGHNESANYQDGNDGHKEHADSHDGNNVDKQTVLKNIDIEHIEHGKNGNNKHSDSQDGNNGHNKHANFQDSNNGQSEHANFQDGKNGHNKHANSQDSNNGHSEHANFQDGKNGHNKHANFQDGNNVYNEHTNFQDDNSKHNKHANFQDDNNVVTEQTFLKNIDIGHIEHSKPQMQSVQMVARGRKPSSSPNGSSEHWQKYNHDKLLTESPHRNSSEKIPVGNKDLKKNDNSSLPEGDMKKGKPNNSDSITISCREKKHRLAEFLFSRIEEPKALELFNLLPEINNKIPKIILSYEKKDCLDYLSAFKLTLIKWIDEFVDSSFVFHMNKELASLERNDILQDKRFSSLIEEIGTFHDKTFELAEFLYLKLSETEAENLLNCFRQFTYHDTQTQQYVKKYHEDRKQVFIKEFGQLIGTYNNLSFMDNLAKGLEKCHRNDILGDKGYKSLLEDIKICIKMI